MPKPDLDEIARRVAAATGIANPDTLAKMKPGAVFIVDHAVIHLPGGPEMPHPTRRVIIVQGRDFLSGTSPKTVMVVPCSASQAGAGRGDFAIPDGTPGFSLPNIVAYTSQVMPILKTDLAADRHKGILSDETFGKLLATIAVNLALAPQVRMPPRS